jgi:hypothetical protein
MGDERTGNLLSPKRISRLRAPDAGDPEAARHGKPHSRAARRGIHLAE